MTVQFAVGNQVVINTPENERLHGTIATVAALAEWGYHLAAPAAFTGAFRAAFDEVVAMPSSRSNDGKDDLEERRRRAIASGCTGDICDKCGSPDMVRDGKCLTCLACGSTSGGCS